MRQHVEYLASKKLEGRATGSHGEQLATQYIADVFRQYGLEPSGESGSYFQTFVFADHGVKKAGHNVLGKLIINPESSSTIILGAHVDHLGYGTNGYSRGKRNVIHPGADDNASGVASMLFVAAALSDLKSQGKLHGNKNILFAAWSGEEIGILGSSHFVKTVREKVDAVINLDMIGHLHEKLVVQGVGSSARWSSIVQQANSQHALSFVMQSDAYLPTDSTAFYLNGIPAINFFTGAHDDYHAPSDTADTLNYAGIQQISSLLVDLMLTLESAPPLVWQEMPVSHHASRSSRIYLGTIPDYAAMDMGVRLSGVISHSPAQVAGLRKNDVIVELAGKKIRDIYDYTSALNGLSVGRGAQMVVMRGGERVVMQVVAGSR